MALNSITGTVKLWANEIVQKDGGKLKLVSISVGSKKEDGSFANYNIPVRFSKEINTDEIINGMDFEIKDSWLSVYESKDGRTFLNLFINKGNAISKTIPNKKKKTSLTPEQEKALKEAGLEVSLYDL